MINLIASTNTSEPTSVITVLDWPEQPDQIPVHNQMSRKSFQAQLAA
jgi:hypothetical protein